MIDEPNKRSRAWMGWALLALLVLYPLSVGPVAFTTGIITGRRPGGLVFEVLYTPLESIAQAVPAVGRPLGDYFDACFEVGRSIHRGY
jgi:hypothetical protein